MSIAIPIPKDAWMQYRSKGRTVYAINRKPIIWSGTPPSFADPVYVMKWSKSQCQFMASRVIHKPKKGTK